MSSHEDRCNLVNGTSGAGGEPDVVTEHDYSRLSDSIETTSSSISRSSSAATRSTCQSSASVSFGVVDARAEPHQQQNDDGVADTHNDAASVSKIPTPTAGCCNCDKHDDTDPHHRIRTASNVSAFVTFLKALFGVSLLSQPRILGETGLVLGSITHIIIISACVFACYLLLKARSMAAMETQQNAVGEQQPQQSNTNAEQHQPQHQSIKSDAEQQPPQFLLSQITTSYHNLRQYLEKQTSSSYGTAFGAKGRLVTYGDLARQLMGGRTAMMISWIIIILHVLFASGMISVAINNLSAFLGWQAEPGPDGTPEGAARLALTNLLFPIVVLLSQLKTLKDLFFVSAMGLSVYLVGCVGSMIYSAITYAQSEENEQEHGPDAPEDMWEWKFDGIPVFVASTVYAIEGINLALPTANNLEDQQRAVPLLFTAVILYGLLTLVVAWIGYIGGMGGGPGTHHGEDACRDLSYCLYSESVRSIYQVSLSVALILTLPVILYPSTEMLEIWATERDERKRQEQQQKMQVMADGGTNESIWYTASGAFFSEGLRDSLMGDSNANKSAATSEMKSRKGERITKPNEKMPFKPHPFSQIEKHFKLRMSLAIIVCILGALEAIFSTYMSFIRGIGLSFAGFVLPPILYTKARERVGKPLFRASGKMMVALACLLCFGVFNMVLVCMSCFTEQEFIP